MGQERNGSENVTQGEVAPEGEGTATPPELQTPPEPAPTQPQAPAHYGQLSPGTVFAGYRIDRVLGHGGMGTVYVAAHPRLPRLDVLKLLNPSFSNDPSFRARFEREADLAGSLEHRNIVSVYDRGVDNGQLWIAMRYVRGYDAASLIRSRPTGIDPAFAVHIISEIGIALDHAHRRGMVHRDVKPANILVESDDDGTTGAIMLTDFGIARAVDDAMHLTDTGLTVASVPYASPEQLHGYELDSRADIYALACTFVELLTGAPPFPRDNRLAAMSAHLHDTPPSVRDRVPTLPPELDTILSIALAKEPDARYRTCAEFCYAAATAVGVAPSPNSPLSSGMHTALITGQTSNPGAHTGSRRAPTSVSSDPRFSDPRFSDARRSDPRTGGMSGRVFSPAGNPDSATQVVQSRGRRPVTPPPTGRDERRKTTILVSLATVLALIGVIAGALAYVDRPDTGTWSATSASIAEQFPQLLPAGPKAQGFGDATCSATTGNGLDAISCTASSGVQYTVWHTPTADDRATVDDLVGSQPGTPRTWAQGPVRVSRTTVANGWVITNFNDSARAPYTVVATWAGHTGEQVLDEWWRNAPFGS